MRDPHVCHIENNCSACAIRIRLVPGTVTKQEYNKTVTMGKHKGLLPLRVLCVLLPILLLSDYVQADQVDNQHYMPPLECYDPYGRPQV